MAARQRNSPNIRPVGKPRVVDLRPGDEFVHGPTQKRYKLAAMSAYRQHQISEEKLAGGWQQRDSWYNDARRNQQTVALVEQLAEGAKRQSPLGGSLLAPPDSLADQFAINR